jgi:transposase/DNA-binding NarL/FixJ family response regulator
MFAKDLLREPATARLSDATIAPVLLTAQPLLRRRSDLAPALRAVPFDLRIVAQWDRLPEGVERIAAAVVLVDMDDANISSDGMPSMSGHRLIKLLKRRLVGRQTALIVITHLDYAEIQDLARVGIHALVKPEITTKALVREICVAAARMRHRHGKGGKRTAEDTSFPDDRDNQRDDTRRPPRPDAGGGRLPPFPEVRSVWGIPDHLWHAITPHLPPADMAHPRRIDDRRVLTALLRLHVTGCAWADLPPEWGSPSTIRRRVRAWEDAGVFERMSRLARESDHTLARVPWLALRMRFAPTRTAPYAPITALRHQHRHT